MRKHFFRRKEEKMKISTKTIVTVGMFTASPRSSFHSSDSDADRCADHPADFLQWHCAVMC